MPDALKEPPQLVLLRRLFVLHTYAAADTSSEKRNHI